MIWTYNMKRQESASTKHIKWYIMIIPSLNVGLDILQLKNICLSTIKKHILKSKITRKLYDRLSEIRVINKQPLLCPEIVNILKNFEPNSIGVVVLKYSILVQCFSGMAKHVARISFIYHWAGRVPSNIQCSYFCLSYLPFMCSCMSVFINFTSTKPSQNIQNNDCVA